ncbi:MAG: hypothetical protein E7523_04645 [Ruminococcaceae bacterium]|nr:hypothetical protein [Oscillospiraceae bacterium]
MKKEKNANGSTKRSKLTEKLAATPFGEGLLITLARFKAKRSQTPIHFYYECQYFSQEAPCVSYVGYLAAGTKEASFKGMKFIRSDGAPAESGDISEKVLHFAVKPYGSDLMYIRRQAIESGADIFGKVISNTRDPILYYKLDKNGKIISPPKRLSERAVFLRSQTCYLLTDENRSFTLYLKGSRNELWELPTF